MITLNITEKQHKLLCGMLNAKITKVGKNIGKYGLDNL